jgi:hypothetical protein
MTARRWTVVAAMCVLAAAACGPRPRTYPYRWQLRGTVVTASESAVTIRHKTGQIRELRIDAVTVFDTVRAPRTWEVLQPGRWVIVDVETAQPGVAYARRIQVFGNGAP